MNVDSINPNTADNILIGTQTDDSLQESETRKISLYELYIALGITSIMIFGIYYMADPATLPIKTVRVEGEFRQLTTLTLQSLVEDRVRGGFFNIDVTSVREAIIKEPWVRDVSVHRVWPDGLRVSVKEQVAVARWKNMGLLNEHGDLFSPDKDSYPDNLPVLEGPAGTEKLIMDKYIQLNAFLSVPDLRIDMLQLNERRAWMFVLDNNLRVIIGRSDFDDRVERFLRYVTTDMKSNLSHAEQIDMRYTNGFAVHWGQSEMTIKEGNGA